MRNNSQGSSQSRDFILEHSNKEFRWSVAKRNKAIVNICSTMLMFGMSVMMTSGAIGAPTGGAITQGTGTIEQVGNATNINQDTQRLDINWQTFSTNVNESVNFIQPNSDAVAINRVVGGVPSELRGALTANGRVFVLNDAGITFYGTSQVNVGALMATTAMDVSVDGDKYTFKGKGEGQVINQGNITVSQGGFAVLAAPSVANSGFIKADLGQVHLASTNNVTVDFRGDNLITYEISKESLKNLGVTNTGTIQAESGQVFINAKVASDIANSVVNLGGVVDADALDLDHNGGSVVVASVGDINITNASIHANGGVSGNGGQIITKADGKNIFNVDASMQAKGGSEAGNGGIIEVSGKNVKINGSLSASAPHGKGGKVILDPATMTIKNGSGVAGTNEIYENTIETLSQGGTDVTVQADNLVTMQNLADNNLHGGSGDIVLQTINEGGRVEFQDLNDKIQTTTGAIGVHAGSGGVDIGSLQTGGDSVVNPGDISVTTTGNGNISIRNVTIDNNSTAWGSLVDGLLNIEAGGNVTVNGNISIDLSLKSNSSSFSVLGKAEIEGSGNVVINGNTTIMTHGEGLSSSNDQVGLVQSILEIDAGGKNTIGSADINGNTLVTADMFVESGMASYYIGEGNYAYPRNGILAAVDISANGAASVDGNTTIQANGEVGGENPYRLDVDAFFEVDTGFAGEGGAASITINGDMDVEAFALMTGYDNHYDSANASIDLDATKDVTINGNTTVIATASNQADNSAYSGNAVANFVIDAGSAGESASYDIAGSINVTGGIDVTAKALTGSSEETSVDEVWYNEADAKVDFEATQDININGNVNIDAVVNMYATATAYDGNADAQLLLEAGYSNEGSGTIPGAIHVDGDVDVDAIVDMSAESGDDAQGVANAYVDYESYDGQILVDGDTLINADVNMNFDSYASDGTANASWDVYALQGGMGGNSSVIINGDAVVTATVDILGGTSSARASATIDVDAANDATINGDFMTVAHANNESSSYSSAEYTRAESGIDIEAGRFGGEYGSVLINGNMIATANALGQGNDAGSVYGTASVDIHALDDVTINGDVTASGDARNTAWNADTGNNQVDAYAYLDITAGRMSESSSSHAASIEIHGNLHADAETFSSNYWAPTDNTASASAYVAATNDVLLDGDATIHAKSYQTSNYEIASGDAVARLEVNAGYDFESGSWGGDIHVMGNVDVGAETYMYGSYMESGDGGANATVDYEAHDGTLTLDGDTKVIAAATVSAYSSANNVSAYAGFDATTTGEDGGDININGNVDETAFAYMSGGDSSASASAEIKIASAANLTINGELSAHGSAQNYLGTLMAPLGLDLYCDYNNPSAIANAEINLSANDALVVSDDVSATANAYLYGYEGSDASADAGVNMNAGDKVTVDGDVDVNAFAKNGVYYGDESLADANFFIGGDDEIEVNGDVEVNATASSDPNYINSVEATADVSYYAYGTLAVNGTTDIKARAYGEVYDIDNASAEATFNAFAHNEAGDAQVIISRDLDLNAEVDVTFYQTEGLQFVINESELNAGALALIVADGDVSLDGHLTINSEINVDETNYYDLQLASNELGFIGSGYNSAIAVSGLFVQAGDDGEGDLVVSGGIDVNAENHSDSIPVEQLAGAFAGLVAGDNVYIDSPVDVHALTTAQNGAYGDALAVAGAAGAAGVVIDSDVLELFLGEFSGSPTLSLSSSSVFGFVNLTGPSELILANDFNVSAEAIKLGTTYNSESGPYTYGSGEAVALAGGLLYATDDVALLHGNADVKADATSNGTTLALCKGECDSSSYAGAGLVIFAGNFDDSNNGEDAIIEGNIASHANTHGNNGEADAFTGVFAENDLILIVEDQEPLAEGNDSIVQQTFTGYDYGMTGTSTLILLPGHDLVVLDNGGQDDIFIQNEDEPKKVDVNASQPLDIDPDEFCTDVNCGV